MKVIAKRKDNVLKAADGAAQEFPAWREDGKSWTTWSRSL